MVRKIKAKLVLQLCHQGLSGRAISLAQGMSRHGIQAVIDAADQLGLGWDDVAEKSEGEVYLVLFPGRGVRESVFAQPDWVQVHRELARVGVMLKLLHQEDLDGCSRAGQAAMSYVRFCRLYGDYAPVTGASSRVGHKAGRSVEVDWSGPTMQLVDPATGERFRRCICSSRACRSAGMRWWRRRWICGRSRGCARMRRCSRGGDWKPEPTNFPRKPPSPRVAGDEQAGIEGFLAQDLRGHRSAGLDRLCRHLAPPLIRVELAVNCQGFQGFPQLLWARFICPVSRRGSRSEKLPSRRIQQSKSAAACNGEVMSTRRDVLKFGMLGGAVALTGGNGGAALAGVSARLGSDDSSTTTTTNVSGLAPQNMPIPFAAVFRRPPELLPYATGRDPDGQPFAKYSLSQKLGKAQIAPGLSTIIAGYNGIFPGPTIRVPQGTRTEVRISNRLPEKGLLYSERFNTVTHLHGSASLPQYDGYANDRTAPGQVKNYHYPNWQAARTLWYHDHNHMLTAQGVYSGLAATYAITDPHEQAQLPQGEFDVPVLISDVMLKADGSLGYNDNFQSGLWGDIITVNGVPWPTMKVKPRVYRFRFLVASVTRSYRFALSTGDPFYLVGTDGGMIPKVQAVSSWRQGTAERYEVLIDFRRYRAGQSVELWNLSNKNNVNYANTGKVMKFRVVADSPSRPGSRTISTIPSTLDVGKPPSRATGGLDTMKLTPDMAVAKRILRVYPDAGEWTINGETWADVEKSNFTRLFANPQRNQVEQWTIVNESGGWFHPVHIHLVDGKIIGRNTNGGKPFAWENGPKDVFYAGEKESVTVLMQFDTGGQQGGRYMVHCHNLVHEDHSMMVQFSVGDLRTNDPIRSDPPVLETKPEGYYPSAYKVAYRAGR